MGRYVAITFVIFSSDVAAQHDGKWTYRRATTCPHGFRTKFGAAGSSEGQDELDGPRSKCKLLQVIVIKPEDYLIKFRCSIEGQILNTIHRLSVSGDQLIMTAID